MSEWKCSKCGVEFPHTAYGIALQLEHEEQCVGKFTGWWIG